MDIGGIGTSFRVEYLRAAIIALLSAATILWWIWIVVSCLKRLQSNQISFLGLLTESGRSLVTTIALLTIIAFL